MNRIGLLLGIDLAMLLMVGLLAALSFTGLTIHEWLGFALCPIVLLHVVLQGDWFVTQFRRVRLPGAWRPRINSFLNLTLLFVMAGTLISGVLVSNQVLPLVGESLGRIDVWKWVHDCFNNILLGVVGLHLALNWNWLVAALQRRRPAPPVDEGAPPKNVTSPLSGRQVGVWRLVLRSLAVLGIAMASALGAYAIFVPIAGPPQDAKVSQHQPSPVGNGTQAPVRELPHQNGRPISLHRGMSELFFVLIVLTATILIGRYGLRLRL